MQQVNMVEVNHPFYVREPCIKEILRKGAKTLKRTQTAYHKAEAVCKTIFLCTWLDLWVKAYYLL